MLDFTQYTPEELTLIAYNLALILANDRDVEELSVISSMLLAISDIIALIASQKANLNSIKERAQEVNHSNDKKEPL